MEMRYTIWRKLPGDKVVMMATNLTRARAFAIQESMKAAGLNVVVWGQTGYNANQLHPPSWSW